MSPASGRPRVAAAAAVVVVVVLAAALVVQRCHCRQPRSRSSFPNHVRYAVSSIRRTSNVCARLARRDSCRRRRRPSVRGGDPDGLLAATNAV